MIQEKKEQRSQILAAVAKKAIMKYHNGDPDAPTVKELIDLMRIYNENRPLGNNSKGNVKNLKNQKARKNYSDLLG